MRRCLYPLLSRAFSQIGAAVSKDSLSYEISASRLLIDCVMLLTMRGGWFVLFFMYRVECC